MNEIVFLLLTIAYLVFLFLTIHKMPDATRNLAERLIGLIPCFDGNRDFMKCLFCVAVMAFTLCLFRLIFG